MCLKKFSLVRCVCVVGCCPLPGRGSSAVTWSLSMFYLALGDVITHRAGKGTGS